MALRETNPNFMNGVPELLILSLLGEQEMYGYEIVQAIRQRTAAVIAVGEGVVYPVLHGLEGDGALKSRRKTINGRGRIYLSNATLHGQFCLRACLVNHRTRPADVDCVVDEVLQSARQLASSS